eukprot:1196987-Rhodomonas_salina.5
MPKPFYHSEFVPLYQARVVAPDFPVKLSSLSCERPRSRCYKSSADTTNLHRPNLNLRNTRPPHPAMVLSRESFVVALGLLALIAGGAASANTQEQILQDCYLERKRRVLKAASWQGQRA